MKKVMVALISIATLGLGIAVPLQANAQPMKQTTKVALESQHRPEYRVQYHHPNQKKWINAGTFRDRASADKEVQKLKHKGYEAQIVTL
ncbi:SPOR domain-containing protein [Microcoleus sp. F6_B4]